MGNIVDLKGDEKKVWEVVKSLNRAWTKEGNADALKDYFHKDMVAITATDRLRLDGREACVVAWKTFAENAKIHKWEELDPKIQIYGNGEFAVVTYYFDMSFEMGGQNVEMGGRDMFVLVNERGRWWIVADQFSAYPARFE